MVQVVIGTITYDNTCVEAGQPSKIVVNVPVTTKASAECTDKGTATLSDGGKTPKTIALSCPKCTPKTDKLVFTTEATSLEVAEYTLTEFDMKVDPQDNAPDFSAQSTKIKVVASTSVAATTGQTAQTIDYGTNGPYTFKVLYTGTLTEASCPKVKVGTVELACSSVDKDNLTGTYTVTKDQITVAKDAYTVSTIDGCGIPTETALKLTVTSSSTTGSAINTFSKMVISLFSLLLL